jgi:membrane associated rhomboid family serine protease
MVRAGLVSFAMHLDWLHLGSNVGALWLFGSTLEDRLGRLRYAIFYLAAIIATMATFQAAFPGRVAPLGAGTAVIGVIALYSVLFPTSRILALFVPVFWIDVIEFPAIVCMAVWLLVQITSAATAMASGFVPLLPWQPYAAGVAWGVVSVVCGFRPRRSPVR